MEIVELATSTWPIALGVITLIIVLAKMHSDIEIIKEKIRTLFDLWNSRKDK
jgi:ABC-type lipoprotein release transport system permease subunit|tara:strand:+ start:100 stop:255 length:156 start_codon:yes stop_codon:yes gene_type:complete